MNNVELIAVVPEILTPRQHLVRGARQAQQHRHKALPDLGPRGPPCVVEEEMGIPLRELIDSHAGGVRGGWEIC